MSVGEDVQEAFQGKRGKVLIIGGGLLIAAYVWYTRTSGSTPEEVVDPNAVAPVVTEGSSRTPQTDPEVGNDVQGATGTHRPENNAEWLSAGTDYLVGRGTPGSTAYNVLNKALGGEPLTEQEKALVSQVISGVGSAPDGMPPLNSAPPAPAKTTTVTTAPGHLRTAYPTRNSFSIYFDKVTNAVGYRVVVSGGGLKQAKTYYPLFNWTSASGLSPGKRYTVTVAGRSSTGSYGPSSTTTATTKK